MQKYHLQNRPNREITNEVEIQEILKGGKYSVISMCRNNEPYIVTLSYGYDLANNALYLHCSPVGLKIDFINSNPHVCGTIIEDGGYVTDECGHNYRTVVFWGKIEVVSNLNEKKYGMCILLNHLEDHDDIIKTKLSKSDEFYSKMKILRLDITQIHAKAGR